VDGDDVLVAQFAARVEFLDARVVVLGDAALEDVRDGGPVRIKPS
jgi:hypothetical protein